MNIKERNIVPEKKDLALDMLRQIMEADELSFDQMARSILKTPGRPAEKKIRGARPAPSDHPALPVLDRLASKKRLTLADRRIVRAIILPGLRPAFDIIEDTFGSLPPEWEPINRQKLVMTKLIRAVGRVDYTGRDQVSRPIGTAFLVGPRLIMTNRHVAQRFTSGVGDRLRVRFQAGCRPRLDLKQEVDSGETILLDVTAPILVHPRWDVALLQVSEPPDRLAPLLLARDEIDALAGRLVAVIGYPAFNPQAGEEERLLQRRMFRDVFDKKRLQPGKIMKPATRKIADSFKHFVEAVAHDCSTLHNNSGSALIDIASGSVIGLHFQGRYLEANYALPAWELAADERIAEAGVALA